MRIWTRRLSLLVISLLLAAITVGCGLPSSQGTEDSTNATPTPTKITGQVIVTPDNSQNICDGLAGTLEMQLLIGPSEAVGLSPYTFATIPFQVVQEGSIYFVEGGGAVEYYEDLLTADWGSFGVTFEGDTSVSGECIPSGEGGTLNVTVEMDGQQTVVVTVEGMETTYPWEGSPTVEASFPLAEGAQIDGEGWALILHLN